MKICRIVNSFPSKNQIKGDLGPNYYYLSKYAVEKGIDVHVVCGRAAGQEKYEEIDGIKVHRVSPIKNRRSYLYGEFAKKSFEKVKELKPDLIHGHTSIHLGCTRNRRKIDAPIITHFHTVLNAYKLMDYLPISYNPRDAIIYRLMTMSYFPEYKYLLNNSDYIVAVSEYCANSIKKYIPNAKIKVIYNGVDPTIFKPIRSDIKKQLNADHLILYVGRAVPWKGIQYLLEATKELNKKFEGLKVLLLGVERPDTKIFCDWLKDIAKKNELDNVIFSKPVPYAELPKYYSAADCFVLPSYPEALGKVILEAQACGCPVVATNGGGIPEILDEGCGLTFKHRNAQDLEDKISIILNNKEQFRGGIGKEFSWAQSADYIIKYYESILRLYNRET